MIRAYRAPLTDRLSAVIDDFAARENITREVALSHARMIINRHQNEELRKIIETIDAKEEANNICGLLKQCEEK